MERLLAFSFLILVIGSLVLELKAENIDNGWGEKINWRTLEDGEKEAKNKNKPLMVLISKTWCGACKALKPKFASSSQILDLSKHFVMVSLEDEDEEADSKYKVDGRYVPRILFQDSKGDLLKDVYNVNGKHKDFKYYYGKTEQIIDSMKKVLERFGIDTVEQKDEKIGDEKEEKIDDKKTEEEPKKEKKQPELKSDEPKKEDRSRGGVCKRFLPPPNQRGFGEQYNWRNFEEGLKEVKNSNKMLLLIIHKSWCGSCQALRPKIAGSKEMEELKDHFVMVNTEDDEEPKDKQFDQDGQYVPRIFFLDPRGKVIKSIWNEGTKHPHVKYYYANGKELAAGMKRAIDWKNGKLKPAVQKQKDEKLEKKDEQTKEKKEKEDKKDEKKAEEMKDPWWTPSKDKNLGRGFGEKIQWRSFEEGLKEAKENNKVMLLIIHRSSCKSSKGLKPILARDDVFAEMSKKFVMVNTEDDEEPKGKQYLPDGKYTPRFLFIEPSGKVRDDIWNEGTKHEHAKYYYQSGQELVKAMKRALKMVKAPVMDHGWGKQYDWVSYTEAFDIALDRKKPIMMVMHKSWCSACKAFKKKFIKSKEILETSNEFVMVNVLADKEVELDKKYDVDGAYVPRIYFINPTTKEVMEEFFNEDPEFETFQFAYAEAKDVVKVMKKVLKKDLSETYKVSDHGFGADIHWRRLGEGLKEANSENKPVMLILHGSWCQLSQGLKEKFAESKEIKELSKNFVMINLQDEEIPDDSTYEPDGTYVPRIFFLDSEGKVRKDIVNGDSEVEDAKYLYTDAKEVINSMKKMKPKNELDKGFGKGIKWMELQDAFAEAKRSEKPVMMILHRPHCPACLALKPEISGSKEIAELSKNFAMVNIEEKDEPKDKQYNVDGKYYPRIFFLDHSGVVQKDLHNTEVRFVKFKYSYESGESVLKTMKRAFEKLKPKKTLDGGLGKEIDWVPLDEGYKLASKKWKPLMLVITKSWCSACKMFKPKFAKSKRIQQLSKQFVMVNGESEDFDATDSKFDIDGQYIPKVLFFDPLGNVLKEVVHVGTTFKESKYYYWEPTAVYRSMEKALDVVKAMPRKKKTKGKDEL